MTTKNNNLSIEQMREIVEGAPSWAKYWITKNEYHMSVISFPNMTDQKSYLIDDLRTAIENHYYGRSEAEELAAYAELSQEKIESGAMLVGDFSDARKIIDKQLESDDCTDIRNHLSPNCKVMERNNESCGGECG